MRRGGKTQTIAEAMDCNPRLCRLGRLPEVEEAQLNLALLGYK